MALCDAEWAPDILHVIPLAYRSLCVRVLESHVSFLWPLLLHRSFGFHINLLSTHNNIDWGFVTANPNLDWNWAALSANTSLDVDVVAANPNLDWEWSLFNRFLSELRDHFKLFASKVGWCALSQKVSLSTIVALHSFPWDFAHVSRRYWGGLSALCEIADFPMIIPKLNFVAIQKHTNNNRLLACPDLPWDYSLLSREPGNLTNEQIDQLAHKPWDFQALSSWRRLEFWLVKKHLEKNWCFHALSNRCFEWDFIEDHPDKNWNFQLLSSACNRDKAWDVVEAHSDWPWHWNEFYSGVPTELFERHIDKNWKYLPTFSKEMTRDNLKMVAKYPDKPWAYCALRPKVDADWAIIRDLSDKNWNYQALVIVTELGMIGWRTVLALKDKPWGINWIRTASQYCVLDTYVIRAMPDKFNFRYLSYNPSLDLALVKEFPTRGWNFEALSRRKPMKRSKQDRDGFRLFAHAGYRRESPFRMACTGAMLFVLRDFL